jgi:hypothetical protein
MDHGRGKLSAGAPAVTSAGIGRTDTYRGSQTTAWVARVLTDRCGELTSQIAEIDRELEPACKERMR